MAKKILLDIHSSPAWYTLEGISCHLRDYRLSYLLNEHLGFRLVRLDDLPYLPAGAREPVPFSLYRWRDEEHFNTYYLVANRADEALLAPKVRQADFLLLIEGPFKKKQEEELLSALQKVPNILLAFPVSFATVKNHENLLTDLELHLNDLQDLS